MAYVDSKKELGREPITFCEIDLGFCSLTYGVAPCTATGAAGEECYNTRFSCQDEQNYTDSTKTYRFCQARANLPIGVSAIPSITGKPSRAETSTTGGQGLGSRATVKIQFQDHTHHDRGVDPYVDNRTYDPETTGTFWGKWIARNPYFETRELRVLTGYINSPFDWADFKTEYYDITDVSGPSNGKVTITGKDILTRTYGDKTEYPPANTGALSAGITDVATSATLTPAGIGDAEYSASGYLVINKEVMAFTRSSDTLTLTRAQYNTTAAAHSADDTVQECVAWSATNVLDVLEELLVTGAGVPSGYIPNGTGENWDVERDQWLGSSNVTGILIEPEPIDEIIGELSRCFMFDIWWSLEDQEIQIKALSPEPGNYTVSTFTDDYNLVADSVSVKKDSKQRVSEVRVHYGLNNPTEDLDDITNYASTFISSDIESETSTKYNSSSIKEVFCRWFDSQGLASALAGRTIARFNDTPSIVSFEVDIKDEDSIEMAQRVELDTRSIQGLTGANEPTKFQVTKISHPEPGSRMKIEGLSSSFTGRYGFIVQNSAPNYSAASIAAQRAGGWICYNTEVFLDGEPAYKII